MTADPPPTMPPPRTEDDSLLPPPDQIHARAVARLAAIGEEWTAILKREWSEASRS